MMIINNDYILFFSGRLQKYNKIVEQNIHLQEQCDVLKVDSMSADQKYKNAQNMYEVITIYLF